MRQLTRYQVVVLVVAWLGWIFDSMDATIYNLVLNPALKELLGPASSQENIVWYGGITLAVFLMGWALGGVLFGICADRFGRARTLVITILIYALCTGLAGLSHTWWQLALYRFLTALGIGGEWAAGLQYLLSDHGWRVLFFAGIAPALVALVARAKVKEPEKWKEARKAGQHPQKLGELFRAEHRRDTLVGSGLAFVAVFGLWGATDWTPSLNQYGRSPGSAGVAVEV